jgi:hypothetical protein
VRGVSGGETSESLAEELRALGYLQ